MRVTPRDSILLAATALLTFVAGSGCSLEAAEDAMEAVTPVETATVEAGTAVDVRLEDHLDSGESESGEEFRMSVARAVTDQDRVLIPEGARIEGVVEDVEPAGRPQKSGRLELRARRIEVRGETIPIDGTLRFEGEDSLEEDLEEIGLGGAIGAALGGILEGAKGAVIGGIAGAGGTFLATKGEQVELEAGTPMILELDSDISVPLSS